LRAGHAEKDLEAEEALEDRDLDRDGLIAEHAPRKTFLPGRLPNRDRRRVHVAR
jgi:hypothetical protein